MSGVGYAMGLIACAPSKVLLAFFGVACVLVLQSTLCDEPMTGFYKRVEAFLDCLDVHFEGAFLGIVV